MTQLCNSSAYAQETLYPTPQIQVLFTFIAALVFYSFRSYSPFQQLKNQSHGNCLKPISIPLTLNKSICLSQTNLKVTYIPMVIAPYNFVSKTCGYVLCIILFNILKTFS